MEESLDGLTLPVFSGRLSADWTAHEARLKSWLSIRAIPLHSREAAEALELSLAAQAALSFEQETGEAERRVWDEAVAWCREKWAGEDRRRLAAASAVNQLNSRSFRERGRRREAVKDLRRVFIGCFFEFPQALHRLSREPSYSAAIAEALVWEGDMHSRQHTQRDPSSASTGVALEVERPVNPTPGGGTPANGLSPAQSRGQFPRSAAPSPRTPPPQKDDLTFRDDDLIDPTDALLARRAGEEGYVAARRASLGGLYGGGDGVRQPYPARSVETLHAYPSHGSSSVRFFSLNAAAGDGDRQPRVHSSLAAYPSPDSLPRERKLAPLASRNPAKYESSCAGTRHRAGFPNFSTPPDELLAPPLQLSRASTSSRGSGGRAFTPPFVTEATSYRLSYASATTGDGGEGQEARMGMYDSFPYPARRSPTDGSFSAYATRPISYGTAAGLAAHVAAGSGREGRSRGSKPPLSPSAWAQREAKDEAKDEARSEEGKKGSARRGTLLGSLFRRGGKGEKGGKGHARSRSASFAPVEEVEGEGQWVSSSAPFDFNSGSVGARRLPLGVGAELGALQGDREGRGGSMGRPPKKRPALGLGGLPP
ncbi:hypothetical protein JCM10213_009305 [Rhodosporidiobolus nylandii]